MDNILYAIYQTVPYGYAAKIADQIGMGQKILANKVNPNNEHHHLQVLELVRLMKVTGDYQALRAIADTFGFRLERKEEKPVKRNIIAVLLDAEAEHGDVSRTMAEALEDGRLTDREKIQALKQIDEAIEALMDLKQAVIGWKG